MLETSPNTRLPTLAGEGAWLLLGFVGGSSERQAHLEEIMCIMIVCVHNVEKGVAHVWGAAALGHGWQKR